MKIFNFSAAIRGRRNFVSSFCFFMWKEGFSECGDVGI